MEEPLKSLEQEYLLLEAKVETRLDVCPAEMLSQNYLITTGQFFELLKGGKKISTRVVHRSSNGQNKPKPKDGGGGRLKLPI